jgi:hypothetical protein
MKYSLERLFGIAEVPFLCPHNKKEQNIIQNEDKPRE